MNSAVTSRSCARQGIRDYPEYSRGIAAKRYVHVASLSHDRLPGMVLCVDSYAADGKIELALVEDHYGGGGIVHDGAGFAVFAAGFKTFGEDPGNERIEGTAYREFRKLVKVEIDFCRYVEGGHVNRASGFTEDLVGALRIREYIELGVGSDVARADGAALKGVLT